VAAATLEEDCRSTDELHRRAVEAARSCVGLERCSLWFREGDLVRGTWGTDALGHLVDEREAVRALNEAWYWRFQVRPRGPGSCGLIVDEAWQEWRGGAWRELGRGEVAVTPVFGAGEQVVGVFCNDNALTGKPLEPAKQRLLGAFATVFGGVLERRRSREGVDRFCATVHEGPCVVMVTDAEGRVEYVNRKFGEVTGCEPERAVGLAPGNPAPEICERVWEAVRGKGAWRGEFATRAPDGSERRASASVSPIRDEAGDITHFIAIGEDVTEASRLREGAEEQRRQALLGQLAAGVAHDFNNQLGVVLGFADILLREAALPEADRKRLASIQSAAQRAADLTQRLLAVGGQLMLRPERLQLNSRVAEWMEIARRLLPESVALKTELAPDLGWICADAKAVEGALVQLILNAREAMPEGGTITVRAANGRLGPALALANPGARAGPCVALSVSDTGCGIPADDLPTLFEPFAVRSRLGRRGGIGLAAVRGFMRQSGGAITVAAAGARGTVATLCFPLIAAPRRAEPAPQAAPAAVAAPSNPAPAPASPAAADAEPAGAEGRYILIAEDERNLRELAAEMLEGRGFPVRVCDGAESALVALREDPKGVALLFTDILMPPGVNGYELARRARELCPSLPVLFTSASTSQLATFERESLPEGSAFLPKPYGMDDLLRLVVALLNVAVEA
jgi:two-component system NtrC family sensor kinase